MSNTFRILITDPLPDEGLALLRAAPDVHADYRPELGTRNGDELLVAAADYDALIVRSGTAVNRELIERCGRLKIIGRAGVALDNVDIAAATERGVMVMNTPESAALAAAEHTLALLLALCRHLPAADASVRRGDWERSRYWGVQLDGKTLGLIGFGRVGRLVAPRAQAFGLNVLAYDPYVEPEIARRANVTLTTLDELLARADFVSLHPLLAEGPRQLIGAAELARMRPGARLINTAHGALVDEAALLAALQSGRLAGAALDVFAVEPPGRSPLFELPNVVVTPHLSSSTFEAQRDVALQIAQQVLDALRGQNYRNVVNLPFIAGPDFRLVRPYLELAEKLGALQSQLAAGPITKVEVEVKGEGMTELVRPLAVALLTGLLRELSTEPVNYVNAPALAAERGLHITQTRGMQLVDYPNLLSCRVSWEGGQRLVAGTLFGGSEARLVQMDDTRMDARPEGHALVMVSRDVPGVIGIVGSLLAQFGVNIAEWRLGRDVPGGRALSFINLDEAAPPAALDAIRALPQIIEVRAIRL
ncbi:MAG: phosphoglycerate dehydrogenase [Anaerolineales bacterium]|nr:phosphoglycerate dehydrogenase [Anaerolineales bacterium]